MTKKAEAIKRIINEVYGDEFHNVVHSVVWNNRMNSWFVNYTKSVKGGEVTRHEFKSVIEAIEFFENVRSELIYQAHEDMAREAYA